MATDGTSFLSGMNFWVTDVANAGAAAGAAASAGAAVSAGGGGGFSMSRDEMESMLAKAEGTKKLIYDQVFKAQRIAQIDPPGHDAASVGFTTTAVDAGNHYLGHLQIQYDRYTQLIEKLNLALGKTVATDEQNADAAQQAGTEGKY
jgi:hypothetical protein